MSFAWETTEDDVCCVLRAHDIELSEEEYENLAMELDTDEIEKAVLRYTNMETQTNAAYCVIEDQLKAKGIIPADAEKEWLMPSDDEEDDWEEEDDEDWDDSEDEE